MIACLCRGVSDHTIRALIARGARSVSAIHEACGAGGDCGACCAMLAALVDQARPGPARAVPSPNLMPAGDRR